MKNLQLFSGSDSTFYNKDIFEELRLWKYLNGAGVQTFAKIYNKRHQATFNELEKILGDCTVGKRKSNNLYLQPARLTEAFEWYELQLMVNDELQKDFTISRELQLSAIHKIETKLIVKKLSNDDNKSDESEEDESEEDENEDGDEDENEDENEDEYEDKYEEGDGESHDENNSNSSNSNQQTEKSM